MKALVADTTYTTPERMFDSQVDHLLGGSTGLFHILTEAEFHLATQGEGSYAMPADLPKLANIPKLFIVGTR